MDIDPSVLHSMRWNPKLNQFEGRNVHVKQIIVVDKKNCDGISKQEFEDRKKLQNHMTWCRLQPGNRIENERMDRSNHNDLIPELFRAASEESGECMWVSAALLVYQMDATAGNNMMQLRKQEPPKYDWLSMYSNRGRRKLKSKNNFANTNNDSNTLVSLMQQNTNYDLCVVK